MAASEFAARRNLLAYNLVEHDLDALVVSFGPNVRYLTGFTGSNGLVAIMPDRAAFFTDPRYRIQAAQEVDCSVRVVSGALLLSWLISAAREEQASGIREEPHDRGSVRDPQRCSAARQLA